MMKRLVIALTMVVLLLGIPGCQSKEEQAIHAFIRGQAHLKDGEYDKAIDEFTEAIRLDPEDADFYLTRGAAYYKKGDQAKSEADFAKAAELNAP